MLTRNDREAIREMIREELREALCRTITIERGPRQQGDPEKVIKEEQWNVLDFMAAYAPKIEAALRGMQEDVERTKNKMDSLSSNMEIIGSVLLGMEQSAMQLAAASDRLDQVEEGTWKLIGQPG